MAKRGLQKFILFLVCMFKKGVLTLGEERIILVNSLLS